MKLYYESRASNYANENDFPIWSKQDVFFREIHWLQKKTEIDIDNLCIYLNRSYENRKGDEWFDL